MTTWDTTFASLFHRCSALHRSGNTNPERWFVAPDTTFLSSIGCSTQEFFDFVDDHVRYGNDGPSMETALLVAAVRRDYLNVVQKGKTSLHRVSPADLPAKSAEVQGIRWLPRLIMKARAKLRGEMDPDTMYGCGGDRAFFAEHQIHPADLLRAVWAAGADDQRIVDFVKSGGQFS